MKFFNFKLPFKIPKVGPELDLEAKITIWIISSFALSILSYLSIIDRAGSFGGFIGALIVQLLGKGSIILPIMLFWSGVVLFRLQKNLDLAKDFNSRLVWGICFILACILGFLGLIFDVQNPGDMEKGGGLFGYVFYPFLLGKFGPFGGGVLLLAIGFLGFFLVSQMTVVQFVDTVQDSLKNPSKFWDFIPDIFEAWKKNPKPTSSDSKENLDSFDQIQPKTKIFSKNPKPISAKPNIVNDDKETGFVILDPNSQVKNSSSSEWKLPSVKILKENHTQSDGGNTEKNKQTIKTTLESFGIQVEMGDVVTGPTVSQYTLKPASGVKLASIDAVQRDLALALAAPSLRLEAPIPGQSLVGIEIPNLIKSQVRIRDLIQTPQFFNFKDPLPVALGKDVAGNKIIGSIAKMPHLLVAGATGAGKSVWINSMLLSLLYRYRPEELQLALVDMKRVELKLYDGVPHLLAPVITDSEKAINALKWTVLEMDRRYKLLEEFGKRNIQDYNTFVAESNLPDVKELKPMPYLVFVIDELGDLMILAKNEVEPIIVRLTQMSRAVGIHIILGTQRPDTRVVTGLIKANIPSRIAFAVASQIDSRVILDQMGAEKLLGQGDGLFMSPTSIQPIRFQGSYVEELEVRKCVSFWRDQAQEDGYVTNLNPEVTETPKGKLNVPGMEVNTTLEEGEDLFEKIKEFIIQEQAASTSMLQTAFGIGYPKARKFIDMLEKEGVVGPGNGSKPREVYVPRG
jgi:S-DNA-T family DNA segregation ATPase FtsK/SpoIIIE